MAQKVHPELHSFLISASDELIGLEKIVIQVLGDQLGAESHLTTQVLKRIITCVRGETRTCLYIEREAGLCTKLKCRQEHCKRVEHRVKLYLSPSFKSLLADEATTLDAQKRLKNLVHLMTVSNTQKALRTEISLKHITVRFKRN